MGSYQSRQIADLVLLLCELNFFNLSNVNGLSLFSRYIDDGFMLTNNTDLNLLTTSLISFYPAQIPITFTSNQHSVNYLDLTISLNHHPILYNKIHYQVYQKPNHKYMYPHFSSNHPQHIFAGIVKTETICYSRLSSTINDYNYIRKLLTLRLKSLGYPTLLIQQNSFPFLTHNLHKQRTNSSLKQKLRTTNNIYYKTKYNKHARTDKIVHHILNKYHNMHIPKLIKTYSNSTKLHSLLLTNNKLHSKLI